MCSLKFLYLLICGVSLLPSQLEGKRRAQIGQFAYQVSLLTDDNFFCGGSIISARVIITVAHCTKGLYGSGNVAVVAGNNQFTDIGVRHKVVSVKIHPQYDESSSYDVALLKLQLPLVFSSKIQAINLPRLNTPGGTHAMISGWGYVDAEGVSPNILQYTNVLTAPPSICQSLFPGFTLNDSRICTTFDSLACTGVAGNTLVANGQLIGISSGGAASCKRGYAAFTAIYPLLDFILASQ